MKNQNLAPVAKQEKKKEPLKRRLYQCLKRTIDFFVALVAILVLSPVFLILALLVAITSRGPVFFKQTRVGKDGKFFPCLKFRSMKISAPQSATSELRHANFYITPIGAFLRKYSLDELPQLFNVLVGQMSLIGPRPLIPAELPVHDLRMRYGVYSVRPGITGWAQINGRDNVTQVQKAQLDQEYVEKLGPRMDIKIILRSVLQVLHHTDVCEGVDHTAADTRRQGQMVSSWVRTSYDNHALILWNVHHVMKESQDPNTAIAADFEAIYATKDTDNSIAS